MPAHSTLPGAQARIDQDPAPDPPHSLARALIALEDLRGVEPAAMYDMILRVVEKPLLEVVMKQAEGNQTVAAQMLGINRNTLRKKLNEHNLL